MDSTHTLLLIIELSFTEYCSLNSCALLLCTRSMFLLWCHLVQASTLPFIFIYTSRNGLLMPESGLKFLSLRPCQSRTADRREGVRKRDPSWLWGRRTIAPSYLSPLREYMRAHLREGARSPVRLPATAVYMSFMLIYLNFCRRPKGTKNNSTHTVNNLHTYDASTSQACHTPIAFLFHSMFLFCFSLFPPKLWMVKKKRKNYFRRYVFTFCRL